LEKIPGIDKPELIGVIVGFLVTHALGPIIQILMEFIKCPECRAGMSETTYYALLRSSSKFGGACIGFLERTLYFIAFIQNPLYIAGLLTFKVAAKWEAWKNIVKVPEKNVGLTASASEFALFRFELGGYYMTRFLIGAFSNILFAIIGYVIYKWILKMLHTPTSWMFPPWMTF
jgi:hypothetical protein